MRLRLRLRLRNLQLASQRGFTTVTLMGVLAVGALLVAASFAAVDPDISLSREDQDQKQAYGAAESGLQWYLNALAKDNNYYLKCTAVPPPNPTEPAPVNQKWDGTSTRVWRKLPGEKAEYTVELLPAPGKAECSIPDQWSMIDEFGNMRLRVTGRSRGEYRSVIATLRRRNFIDFIYFTDFETLDPAAYNDPDTMSPLCSHYREERAGNGCTEIQFTNNDDVLGPLHTNDSVYICGNPQFGRTTRDMIEINGPDDANEGFYDACAGAAPDLQGHPRPARGHAGDAALEPGAQEVADPAYKFLGFTQIQLQGSTMLVRNFKRFGDNLMHSVAWPAKGVIYVGNDPLQGGCTAGYDRSNDYSSQEPGCGDVWISGNYGDDLTVAADNDVVINGHLDRNNEGLLLGLIANNFVRLYHPVYADDDCDTNDAGTIQNPRIQAAILALNHSFIVDNWRCGDNGDRREPARGRRDRAEVPWPGRNRERRDDQDRLSEGLRVQRPAALPRAAVLP